MNDPRSFRRMPDITTMKRTLRSLLLLLSITMGTWASATHLVGGNLGYTYLGETAPGSGIYRYRIEMQFYLNCGINSNFQTFQDLLDIAPGGQLPVGVYLQNPQNPNADKVQFTTVGLDLVDDVLITPDLPDNCTVGEGLCTRRGQFEGIVDLPLSFSGYHLYFQMCCRNLDIDNLDNPNGTGIGYYAFIPATLVNNSSPTFLGVPTPFLCISDTTTFVNSASDPDGDQLIFSFETPYNSVSQMGGVQPPPGVLPWPVPQVQYAAGFSAVQPFGVGGYSFINGATGLTEYQPPIQGNYVVSVEVKEFRNGQLIGRTRRDLQLQAIPCPPNNTPEVNGQLNTSYTVNAGEQLCFNLDFLDVNADSLFLNANGTIFDPSLYNPAATIDSSASGSGSVQGQFCWNTACDQGQDQPYLFSVSVVDNGCPPKSLDIVFQVQVVPFDGPGSITGPLQVCAEQSGSAYSTAAISDAEFNWVVTGGTIATGQGTNSITVDWGPAGPGSVSVSATNDLGCTSAPVAISVNIAALPVADAGDDVTICAGSTVTLGGSPTGPNGSSFSWQPAGTLNNATIANPIATPVGTTDYIVSVSNSGCADQDTVRISISSADVSAGPDVAICAGDTTQLQVIGTGDVLWSPADGLSAIDIPNPLAFPSSSTDYIVTLTDSLSCVAVDTVRVTVNPLPVVNAGADTSACINEEIVLGGSPTGPDGSIYVWSPSAGLNDATLPNPIATITMPMNFTVTVTDANNCTSSGAVFVDALPIPDVDAGPDTSICSGEFAQLNGTGSGTLLWSPIFGLSDPTIGNPTANPEVTTVYTLTVTGGNFCVNTDQTTVTVNVLPNANAGPDLQVCLGDSVQIQAVGPGQYSWTPANTLSDPNIANPFAFPTVTTTYVMTLSDDLACSDIDSMTVFVSTPANAGTGNSITVCASGLPFNLFNLLGGSPSVDGTWTDPDGLPSDGSYSPGTSTPGDYTYSVDAPPPCGPATAVITVIETPTPNAGQDAFLPLCSNSDPVDLFTALGNAPDTGGTWTDENGQPFSGIYDPATTVGSVFTYFLSAIPPCADDFANVTVFVTQAPDPGADATVTLCASGDAFAMIDSLGGTPEAGGVWLDAGGSQHSDTYDPAVDGGGAYVYTLSGSGGCADTSATLTVIETVPNTTMTGDSIICIGDTTQLANSGNVSYQWSPATGISDVNIPDPFFFPSTTTTYTLTVTDAGGCIGAGTVEVTVNALPTVDAGADADVCAGLSTTIGGNPTGPAGSSYQWSPVDDLSDPTASNPTAQPAGTTTYTVVVIDGNACSATDSITVTVNPLPAVDAGADTSFCQGGSVQLSASGTGQFAWSPADGLSATDVSDPVASPTSATTYTVTVTDGNQCSNTDAITVAVLGLPTADAGDDRYLCPGFAVQLQGNGSGTPLWSPSTDLNDANVFDPQASPVTTTVFTLTITDGNGCSANDEVEVQVSTDPPVDAGADQSICQGQEVTIGGSPTAIPGTTVLWTPSTGLDDPTALNPTATPGQTTQYTVTVTSDTCTSQDVVEVTLQGVAEAGFTVRLEPTCEQVRAFFTDQSSGASQWLWEFGDGSTSTEEFPQHYFPYGTDIVVTLTVTDGFGCTGTITQTFPVSTFPEYVDFEIPNVFTPNDDGKNDVFTLNSNGILGSCVNMQVFNRWGQKVFESLGNDISWTGRNFAGEPCVTGTYFYTITVKDMAFNGTIYLNR